MYIYKITNIVNNKVYIGQTIQNVQKRFRRHINDAVSNKLNTHFCNAVRKYGKENFIIEAIDNAQTQAELNKKEQYYIEKYNSTNSDYGYNESADRFKCGGNTYYSKSDIEMDIIKEKIRHSKIGAKNPNTKSVKCLNIKTNQELFFDTVGDCQIYFGENTHRFITTRVTEKTKSPYKGEWLISYSDNTYLHYITPNFSMRI